MRKFFVGLFIVSLLAVGGTYYWRTYHPESNSAEELRIAASRSPQKSLARDKAEEAIRNASAQVDVPSQRQDWAMIISVVSSIVSALGAMAQVWLTHRGLKA
jgi:hypothetical protein